MACRRGHHNGEDVPGLPAAMPPHLLVHPLPSAPRQPRRAHLQVIPGQSRTRLFVQFCGERWLRSSGRKSSVNRSPRRSRHLLRMLQNYPRLEIYSRILIRRLRRGELYVLALINYNNSLLNIHSINISSA